MKNVLIERIRDGRIANAGQLRRVYRLLASRCHPDATGSSGDAFVRLQAAYAEAGVYLRERGAVTGADAPTEDPLGLFVEVVSQGYPRELPGNRSYRRRCEQLMVQLTELDFTAATARMQYMGADAGRRQRWARVQELLYLIVSEYYNPMQQVRRQLDLRMAELQHMLQGSAEQRPVLELLEWMAAAVRR